MINNELKELINAFNKLEEYENNEDMKAANNNDIFYGWTKDFNANESRLEKYESIQRILNATDFDNKGLYNVLKFIDSTLKLFNLTPKTDPFAYTFNEIYGWLNCSDADTTAWEQLGYWLNELENYLSMKK